MRWLLIGLIGLTVTGACSPEDSHLFFTDVPYPDVLPQSQDDLRLEMVGEYGDRDRGLVVGNITDLAVSATGILAVLDRIDCQVWIVDTKTGDGGSLGGCGDGPGEFRTARTAAFTGDTLAVFDAGRNSLVKISLEGEEIDRFDVRLGDLGAHEITDLDISSDGSILAGLTLFPNEEGAEHLQIASFDGSLGSVNGRGLVAPPVARGTPRRTLRYSSLCGAYTENFGEVVVAVNTWGPQLAILRRNDFRPLMSVRVPVQWARALEGPGSPGGWIPIGPVPGVACGERYAVVGYRYQRSVPGAVSEVLRAVMVVIDLLDGSITTLGGDEPPVPGSILFMTPAAATGDRFFFFTNSFFGYPVVREYRIVEAERDR